MNFHHLIAAITIRRPRLLATRVGLLSLLLCACTLARQVVGQVTADAAEQAAAPSAEQIAALEESLSNAALIGNFTVTGRNDGQSPRLISERYELSVVKHLDGDNWLFQARIKYGEHDLTIPLTLPVKWAGDTPIITVNNIPFPGMGTYTARVMIYRDHYAGFWTGADHGGHLFGVVERLKPEDADATASEEQGEAG